MSNYLAIATVTAALRQMLSDAVGADVSEVDVTILPPDHTTLKDDAPRLNLFLYQVTPSAAWRNADLPTRRADGSVATKPQLGLDLHYLLTAYGKATNDNPEVHRVLGSALRTLHERPVLTRNTIRGVLGQNSLGVSDLAEQVEMVKLTLQTLSTDELSKLWQVFSQTPYRLSVVYQASVVLIDGKEMPRPTLPVSERKIHVLPFSHPMIKSVSPQIVTAHAILTVQGQNLKGEITKVRYGTALVDPDTITDTELVVTLPEGLRAGLNTVQVVHPLDFGTKVEPHRGFESNVAPFVLRPTVIKPVSADRQPDDTVQLGVRVDPMVRTGQRVTVFLNEWAVENPAIYAIDIKIDMDTSLLRTAIEGVKTGGYLVRLRVDSAESLPEIDHNPQSPTFNQYTGEPSVRIECFKNCLRSTNIDTTHSPTPPPGDFFTVSARVGIKDENGSPVQGATVSVRWTLPDGGPARDSGMTDANGLATFDISGGKGTYTLSVLNIEMKHYTFDALKSSVLQRTEIV